MKRSHLCLIGLILVVLLGALGWRARHRIRGLLFAVAERKQAHGLTITADESMSLHTATPVHVAESDWPWWRGLQHDNHASGPLPPIAWSETENILWKSPIPGRGHSSPCILGHRIFLTTAVEDVKSQQTLCLDINSGKMLWAREIHRGEFIHLNAKDSPASSTPATDGNRVFVLFAVNQSIWLSALTLEGEILWQCEVGPYVSKEGFGASPLLVGDLVIVAADNVNQSWIAAVHRTTGTIVWRTPRGQGVSYASPTLITVNGRTLVTIAGLDRVTTYQPESGSESWRIPGPDLSASTPVVGDGMLFVTSCTQPSGIFGIRISDPPEMIWNHPIKVEVPSPLYFDGLVYFAQDIGVMLCYESESGKQVWRQRLGGNISASPVLVGNRILVAMEDGRTLVLNAGREYSLAAENQLECDGLFATPAISQGRIVLRTVGHLYGIGTQQSAQVSATEQIE